MIMPLLPPSNKEEEVVSLLMTTWFILLRHANSGYSPDLGPCGVTGRIEVLR